MRLATGSAGLSWGWRTRWLASGLSLAVTAAVLASLPLPASAADPVLPPGATAQPPSQPSASPLEPSGPATTEDTQGAPGPGLTPQVTHPQPHFGTPLLKDWKPTGDRPADSQSTGFREGVSVEDTSARTVSSTEFANPDGSRTRKVFQGVAFVPKAGDLQAVDTTLKASTVDGRLEPTTTLSPVSFATSASASDLVRLDLGDGVSLGFGIDGAADASVSVSGDVATYRGVRTETDLKLSATTFGMKDELVLRSDGAPSSWLFPLRTLGATPRWDEASKSILLEDRRGNVAAVIPPGFMTDASLDARTGAPTTSTGVTYTLLQRDTGWALQVDLDRAWLNDPVRVWPVTVDPQLYVESDYDDTFVSTRDYANQNNSAQSDLLVGTYDWGGEVSETYLHFDLSGLSNKLVQSASLSLYNYWSYSCTPAPVSIYEVAQPWAGSTTTSWNSRPAYYTTALDTQSFAYGYSGCAQGPNWASWNIPENYMNAWAHAERPWYGLALQASYSDSLGWKRFYSHNGPGYYPVIWVTYVLQPAGLAAIYPPQDGTVDTLYPTLWVQAYDPTHPPVFKYRFKVCGGTPAAPTGCHESAWDLSSSFALPPGWLSGWSTKHFWQVNIDNGTTESGYQSPDGLFFTAVVPQPGITTHLAGAPEGADLAGVNPQVGNYATTVTDAKVATVGPPLQVVRSYNSQDPRTNGAFGPGWSTPWDQRIELEGDGSGSALVTLASGLQVRFGRNPDGITYAPPPGRNLDLVYAAGPPATWTLRDPTGDKRVFDDTTGRLLSITDSDGRTQTYTYVGGAAQGTNLALNKTATGSAACSGTETPAKAVNGSLSDKFCSSTGPRFLKVDLGSAQTVSSVVLHHAEDGGEQAAWNTRDFDIQVSTDNTNWTPVAVVVGNVSKVTTHEFAPTSARYIKLNITTPTSNGDTAARIYEMQVYGGSSANPRTSWLSTVTDPASARTLSVQWTGPRIKSVSTNPPAGGGSPLTWTYTYTNLQLSKVCTPLRATACTNYTYTTSSHYRSVVLDANPTGYWPLGETTGTTAANAAARTTGEEGTYDGVTLNQTGVLTGSPDPAATFTGASQVRLPDSMVSTTRSLAVEAWFKAASGASGTLFAEQNPDATGWAPMLYVGTDGILRGMAPVAPGTAQFTGAGGLCLQPAGGSPLNGTSIVTATCNSGAAQQVRAYSDGTLRMMGKCIDITGANPGFGVGLQLYDCTGHWNQLWAKTWWGGLYNAGSTMCIDVNGSSSTVGVVAMTWGCTGGTDQQWASPTITDPMATPSTVTDGQWHHVVLTVGATGQTIYLDGKALSSTITGPAVDHRDLIQSFIGNGKINPGYVGAPGYGTASGAGVFSFNGQIDEVAYYRHPLSAADINEHYLARASTTRLATIADPIGTGAGTTFTSTNIVYNHATGRINTLTDRHGATWTVGNPTVGVDQRVVRLSNNTAPTARTIDYTYDTKHNGQLVARAETGGGTRQWKYNDDGFVEQFVDENADATNFVTDDRGNVLQRQTCRAAGNCQTQYFGYWPQAPTALDKLDPRTDKQIWSADARSANNADTTYRTDTTIDTAGRPTLIKYPTVTGPNPARPQDKFDYTDGTTTNGSADGITPPPAGLLWKKTDRNDKITEYRYNPKGDLVKTIDPVGLITTNTLDDLGRIATTTRGDGTSSFGVTSFTYNGLSLPDTITAPAVTNPISTQSHQALTTMAYNDAGLPTSQTIHDIANIDQDRVTSWQYDSKNRLNQTTAPDGTIQTQVWNSAGDITDKTLPTGLHYKYTYDYAHRLTFTTAAGAAGMDPENAANTADVPLERRNYDAAGRLYAIGQPNNREWRFRYYGDDLPWQTIRIANSPTLPEVTVVVEERAYDAAGHVTTLTVPGPNVVNAKVQTSSTYDNAGNLATQTFDPTGLARKSIYSYDLASNVLNVTEGTTSTVVANHAYTYDDAGRVLESKVWQGANHLITPYVRDARGLVISQTDPSGVTTTFTYDNRDQLVTTTGETRTVYDGSGASSNVAPVTTLGRNTFNDVTDKRDPLLNRTQTTYDKMGRALTVTKPSYTQPRTSPTTYATAQTVNQYTNGLLTSVTDPGGHVTSYTYDPYGRVKTRTDPDPDGAGSLSAPQWTYTYNRNGDTTATTMPVGSTSAVYNKLGQQTSSSQTESAGVWYTSTFEYDDAGNRISSKTPSPHQYVTTTTFNAAGEVTKVTDHTGRFTATSYDHAGRPTYTVSGRNTTYANPGTSTTFNYAGFATATGTCQVNSTTGACTGTTLTTNTVYNGAGQPTDVTSPAGRPTHYTYDDGGQLASITQYGDRNNQAGTANIIQLGYDAAGNKTRMTDGENHTTTYAYNTWNLLDKVTEPTTTAQPALSDRQWITSYNADGLVVQEDLPGSVTRTKTYDNLDRLTDETGTGAGTTTARHLEYDAMGRITAANSPAGNHTYTWTDRGQLKTATGYGGNVSYTYDGEAMLTQRVDAAGTANFTYWENGSLKTVVDPLTSTTATYTYDDAGRPVTINHGGSNSIRTYTYDPYGRIDTDTVTPSTGTPTSTKTDYDYLDKDGLVTSKTTTGVTGAGANTYHYDDVGRIDTWISPGGTTTTYAYDKASNRKVVKTGNDERTSTFDARNRITGTTSTAGASLPADSYTWNPRGQLTGAVQNGQTLSYAYDVFERLTQVSGSATPTTSYTYDSLDRVAQRNLSNFGYHDLENNPVVSPAASGETKLLRDPLGAALAAKTGSSSATTLLDDPLHGDVTATTSVTSGVAAASANYDPWGVRTSSGGSVPLGYQGGYTDPDTGLTNALARWYNPTLGAFNSRDTWTLDPRPVQQGNRYLYANGAPLNGRDPSGHVNLAADGGPGFWDPNAYNWANSPVDRRKASQLLGEDITQATVGQHISIGYKGQFISQTDDLTITMNADGTLNRYDHPEQAPQYDNPLEAGAAGGWDWLKRNTIDLVPNALQYAKDYWNAQQSDWDQLLYGDMSLLDFLGSRATAACHIPGLFCSLQDVSAGLYNGIVATVTADSAEEAAYNGTQTTLDIAALFFSLRGAVKAPESTLGSCLHSFAPQTRVLMADGSTKAIETIATGDVVLATDTSDGSTEGKAVSALYVNVDSDLVDVEVAVESSTNDAAATDVVEAQPTTETIHTTARHPFWDATTATWAAAAELTPGHTLATTNGQTATVMAVTPQSGVQTMRDLTVADAHTYYVVAGNTPVLVHNTGPACGTNLPNPSEGYPSYRRPSGGWITAHGEAGPGLEWEHVVEQSQIRPGRSGFPSEIINHADNILPVPKAINSAKNAYYGSVLSWTSGQTLRDFITGMPWYQQWDLGMFVVRQLQSGAPLPR